MCGGFYENFKTPKALTIINGEKLVERTIRLLRENGVENIYISANNDYFDYLGLPILKHENSYRYENGKIYGYWVDAYYPYDKPCVYLHGDVYYSDNAIKKIVNYNACYNTFIGNEIARNKEHKNWGEPFGYIVVNQLAFKDGIRLVKEMQDGGYLKRGFGISWELYRVLNGLDPNKMYIYDNTYLSIDDETSDIDAPWQIKELDKRVSCL